MYNKNITILTWKARNNPNTTEILPSKVSRWGSPQFLQGLLVSQQFPVHLTEHSQREEHSGVEIATPLPEQSAEKYKDNFFKDVLDVI